MEFSKLLTKVSVVGQVCRGVRFDLIIDVNYYDGPETGFAFYSSGTGIKFSTIGESRYPILRAFEFLLLDGNWPEMIKCVSDSALPGPSGRMVFSDPNDEAISKLERAAWAATEKAYFVGLGNAYLRDLAIISISRNNWVSIKENVDCTDRYKIIHSLIKEKEKQEGSIIFGQDGNGIEHLLQKDNFNGGGRIDKLLRAWRGTIKKSGSNQD